MPDRSMEDCAFFIHYILRNEYCAIGTAAWIRNLKREWQHQIDGQLSPGCLNKKGLRRKEFF